MAQYADFDAWLVAMHARAIPSGEALTQDETERHMLSHIDGLLTRMQKARKTTAVPVPYTVDEPMQGAPCRACGTRVVDIDGDTVEVRPDGFLGQTHRCPKRQR